MEQKLQAPPSVKGIESALVLLGVVQQAKELEKVIKPLKEYCDKANKYFSDYLKIKDAEQHAATIEAAAEKRLKDADEAISMAKAAHEKNVKALDNKIAEAEKEAVKMIERAAKLDEVENNQVETLKKIDSLKKEQATKAKQLEALAKELEVKKAAIAEQEAKIKAANKALG